MKMPFALLIISGIFSTSALAQDVADDASTAATPETTATEQPPLSQPEPEAAATVEQVTPEAVPETTVAAQPRLDPPETQSAVQTLGVSTSGFMRLGYRAILQDDASPDFVGQNDGFYVESARLNINLAGDTVSGRLSLDGAVNRYDARNTAEGEVSVSLLDAYFDYEVGGGVHVRTGQFRPAFDLEAARTRDEMVFVDRAVYNRGVRGVDGFNTRGLGVSREVGLAIHGKFGASGSMHGEYQVALTNGEGSDSVVNDNELPAASTRITIGYKSTVVVGLASRFNRRTTGVAPDRIAQDELSLSADLQFAQRLGANTLAIEGALSQRDVEIKEVGQEPSMTMLGFHAAAMLSRGAVTLAYRYASYDPTAKFGETADGQLLEAFGSDTLVHHTVGLSYRLEQAPLTLQANFTAAQEDNARAYANDRVDLLAQLVF